MIKRVYLYLQISVWRKSMMLSICSQSSRQITGKAAVSTVVWTLCDLRCSPLLTLDYVPSSSRPSHKVSLYWQKNIGKRKKGTMQWTWLAYEDGIAIYLLIFWNLMDYINIWQSQLENLLSSEVRYLKWILN